MDVIYGIKITDAENKHVREAEAWVEGFNQGIEPGRFWVDFLPFRKSWKNSYDTSAKIIFLCSEVHPRMVPRSGVQKVGRRMEA